MLMCFLQAEAVEKVRLEGKATSEKLLVLKEEMRKLRCEVGFPDLAKLRAEADVAEDKIRGLKTTINAKDKIIRELKVSYIYFLFFTPAY